MRVLTLLVLLALVIPARAQTISINGSPAQVLSSVANTGQTQSMTAAGLVAAGTPMKNFATTVTSTTAGAWSVNLSVMGCSSVPVVTATVLSQGTGNGQVDLATVLAVSATAANGNVITTQAGALGGTPFAANTTAQPVYIHALCN